MGFGLLDVDNHSFSFRLIMSDNILEQCLSLTPVPYLNPAFSAFTLIWSFIQQATTCKKQLETLAQSIAELLFMLDKEYRAKRLLKDRTNTPLDDLCRFVNCTPA
jgi:hypothetical protein